VLAKHNTKTLQRKPRYVNLAIILYFLNNHVVYHARTAFTDGAGEREHRRLYRLWLSMPNSRALPQGHEVLWGTTAAGALRGGIGQVEL